MFSNLHKYWLPLTLVVIWTITWKGIALWRAAKKNDKSWFVALLIINTAGLLEIFYLLVFSKRSITPKSAD